MSSAVEVLERYQTDLESSLKQLDLFKLSQDLLKNRVLSKDVYNKLASLDPDPTHLEPVVKVRYLLKLIYDRVRENDSVYGRLMCALSAIGGEMRALCRAMGGEVKQMEECTTSEEPERETLLVEEDIPDLVESLVSGSHLWDAIGIALNLPKHKREDCGEGKENVNRLSNILTAWILGGYEGARPATLSSLRRALASETEGLGKLANLLKLKTEIDSLPGAKKSLDFFNQSCDTEVTEGKSTLLSTTVTSLKTVLSGSLVQLPDVAQHLDAFSSPLDSPPPSKRPCLRGVPLIEYQSYDTEVAEGKSTLLEVQVRCSGCESYQWSKDGEPLLDEADFCGVCSNILYINRASQCTEGKYSCRVSRGSETECSDDINLSVIYPPEKKELLEFYSLTDRDVLQDSWPPVGNPTFINLVLIQQKPMTCNYYTIRGDMDDIVESKEVAEYEEVFREYREGALVLVEGRPGSGKTTLVNKLTRDWATGKKVLQGAKIVFLVTLRLLNVSGREKSLLDLLQIFYDEDLSKIIEHSLRKCRGKGACFILDGLDEYPIESKKNLVIDQLLFSKTFLPHSMVIVASRPVATKDLKTMCRTRIEVVGFSKDQIYSYVRTYPFNGCSPCMARKMTEFLDQHPNVLHMCYLPVHAAMICFLFSELEEDIPLRETQILEQFIITTIAKHQARKGEELHVRSLKNLSGEIKELFSSICKIAFDMLINSQQVVSQSDAPVSIFTDSALGLLTVERKSKLYYSEDFYTFSHLSLQEFLAAFHMHETQLRDEDLVDESHFNNVWRFYFGLADSTTIDWLKQIMERNWFINSFQCAYESQLVEICDLVIKDEVVSLGSTLAIIIAQSYVINTTTEPVKEVHYSGMRGDEFNLFVSMVTSSKLQSIKCLKVTKWWLEDVEPLNNLLSHLPNLEELDIMPLSLNKSRIECLTTGVTLPHLKILKIPESCIYSCPLKVLKQLAFGSKQINKVFYCSDNKTVTSHAVLKTRLLCAFNFQRIEDNHKSWLYLCNLQNSPSLPRERLSHCTEVVLVNCCIGDEGAEILANTLNTSVLENLGLDFNRINDSGAIALAGCLSKCSVVQEVSIECNSIGDSGATALADALVHCTSLRRLDLQGNSLGDTGAVAIAKAAKSLPNLDLYLHNVNITEEGIDTVLELRTRTRIRSMKLISSWDSVSETDVDTLKNALYCGNLPALNVTSDNIYNIEKLIADQQCVGNVSGIVSRAYISDDTVPTLCRIIQHLPTLHHIDCSFVNEISSRSVHLLSDCINSCKSLHSLTLSGSYKTKLHSGLLDAVKSCTQLRSLRLSRVDISFDNVSLLFDTPESWINLHTLKLSDFSIGSDGAQVLRRMLEHCKKLRSLKLYDNSIGDRGAIAIAEALKDHTNLLELRMSHNGITSEGVTALSQVIKCNHLQHIDLSGCESFPISLVDVMCGDSLHTLCLSYNELGVEGMASLSVGLEKCKQLVKLDIDHSIDTHGLIFLEEGLQHCTNLQELRLSENNITSDGVAHISAIMKYCKYLRHLNINFNIIGVDDAAVLVSGWPYKTMLRLYLLDCFGEPHDSALRSGSPCCSSCVNLLELYYNNDYVTIPTIPKLVSLHYCDINKSD